MVFSDLQQIRGLFIIIMIIILALSYYFYWSTRFGVPSIFEAYWIRWSRNKPNAINRTRSLRTLIRSNCGKVSLALCQLSYSVLSNCVLATKIIIHFISLGSIYSKQLYTTKMSIFPKLPNNSALKVEIIQIASNF